MYIVGKSREKALERGVVALCQQALAWERACQSNKVDMHNKGENDGPNRKQVHMYTDRRYMK